MYKNKMDIIDHLLEVIKFEELEFFLYFFFEWIINNIF